MAAELLARVRAEIDVRMAELRPALAEYERLLDAASALESDAKREAAAAPKAPVSRKAPTSRKALTSRNAPTSRNPPRASKAPASGRGAAARKTSPARPTPAEEAIAAALEHGSHTLGELVLVTAIPGRDIRQGLRRLQRAGTVLRARREGRAAYALSSAEAD